MYIVTYTGKKFSLLDPQPEDVCIEDVAHHLSMICRFNGACEQHYSVAQHCVLLSKMDKETPQQSLFHDAGEAYYGDVSSPMKAVLEQLAGDKFRYFCDHIDSVIFDKFGIEWPCHQSVKDTEEALFSAEWWWLMNTQEGTFIDRLKDIPETRIVPWTATVAEIAFLQEVDQL